MLTKGKTDRQLIASCVSVHMSRYEAREKFEEHERGVKVASYLDIRTAEAGINKLFIVGLL